ncbi:hypothetical protein HA388_27485, partial [Escherichia coli]|nr:hypothetical protein [Escherichia coli]
MDRARYWFQNLPSGTITSFKVFEVKFLAAFKGAGELPMCSQTLSNIKQGQGEKISSYMERFRKIWNQIHSIEDET